MNLLGRAFVKSAVGAARYRLTGRRAPLSVLISVTGRCDAMCSYCDAPRARDAMSAAEILALLDELAGLGCNRVSFGGAEPLLRPELPAFVDRCREHGLWTVLETNGHALPDRVNALGSVSRVMISLDGPESVHDAQREAGTFRQAMAGIRAARANGIPVGTLTVLTRGNVEHWPEVLDLAEAVGFSAAFQPLWTSGAVASVSAGGQNADGPALRRAFAGILEAKKAGRPVAMTEKVIRFLMDWPDHGVPAHGHAVDDLVCMAGQISCAIDADGELAHCGPRLGVRRVGNVRDGGFLQAFSRLADNSCHACTSVSCTEASFLYNLNTPVVIEVARAGGNTFFRGAA